MVRRLQDDIKRIKQQIVADVGSVEGAAETLAAFHRGREEQTLGISRGCHTNMVRRLQDDIKRIKQLADGGRPRIRPPCSIRRT
jgi:GTP cyclohydrolase III